MKQTRISIIIVTKNRPKKLISCIDAIEKNTYKEFELIIVDQSKNKKINSKVLKSLSNLTKIKYFKTNEKGKSKGLNIAIKNNLSPLIAFTDDDCLVDKKWLENIVKTFDKNPNISGIFGRTIPYQAKKNKKLICPSTFNHVEAKYINKPCKHWEDIGFGNNMAWRKKFFKEFGLFKEWLGPGSIGSNAEDAEIALRALINKQTLFFEPKIIVKHNKWLTEKELEKQELSYICGEMACYGYLALCGHRIGKDVVKKNIKYFVYNIRTNLIDLIKFKRSSIKKFYKTMHIFFAANKGIFVALTKFYL